MKKWQRRKIYKEMIPYFTPNSYHTTPFGFCHLLENDFNIIEIEQLPELLKQKPKRNSKRFANYWWSLTPTGHVRRVQALLDAINLTKC